MIGRKITINDNVNLHDLGVVEIVDYPLLSRESIYKERVDFPDFLQKKKRITKPISVSIRIIKDNVVELREKIDEIVGLSYLDEPISFLLDDEKFCKATLESADKNEFISTGLLNLEFTNLDGFWSGEEKTTTESEIDYKSKIESEKFKITLIPNSTNCVIKKETGDKLELTLFNTTSKVYIDFENKTIKQNNRHVPISLDSRFFKLKPGSNIINVEGATAEIKYREIIAL